MRIGCLFFLAGIYLLLRSSNLPANYLAILVPVLFLLRRHMKFISLPLYFLCGFFWALFRVNCLSMDMPWSELENRKLTATGSIVSLPDSNKLRTRFEFRIKNLRDKEKVLDIKTAKVRLSWYGSVPVLVPGDLWQLQIKLKRPHGVMNPGSFDYEGWLFRKGIAATGYVIANGSNYRIQETTGAQIDKLRHQLWHKLLSMYSHEENIPLILGLSIGDRSQMTSQQWRVLRTTGTNHLLAISGLHIGFIATLAYFLIFRLWPLAGVSALWIATPYVASTGAIMTAFLYAAMAGFSLPTQRALLMLTVFLVLNNINRETAKSRIFCLTLIIVLLVDPFAIAAADFWLSFGAVSVIYLGTSFREKHVWLLWKWTRIQVFMSIGLLPLLALWFQQFPLTGLISNLIAVPWISLVTVPLVMVGNILLMLGNLPGMYVMQIGITSLDYIWLLLEAFSKFPYSSLTIIQPRPVAFILGLTGVLLMLLPRGLPCRIMGAICILPLFFPWADKIKEEEYIFTLLDVGQGLSAVIRTRQHVLVYDTGPKYNDRANAGTLVITPYLRHIGVVKIDKLVISHGDNDHKGGLDGIVKDMRVEHMMSSKYIQSASIGNTLCRAGDRWKWDGVEFEFLHPDLEGIYSDNDSSCVLRVSNKFGSVLLTGDIEKRAEMLLVGQYGGDLSSTVMVAPHHGSNTSSTASFIAAVDPEYVLFPAGYQNRFNFPKQDIISRYDKHEVKMLTTASTGAITLIFSPTYLRVSAYRQEMSRFWHTKH